MSLYCRWGNGRPSWLCRSCVCWGRHTTSPPDWQIGDIKHTGTNARAHALALVSISRITYDFYHIIIMVDGISLPPPPGLAC